MAKRSSRRRHDFSFSFAHHGLPVTVWLVAVACVVGLFYSRSQRIEVLGLTRGMVHEVANTSIGRLRELPVELYTEVKQGQTVAVIDTQPERLYSQQQLEADRQTILAQIEYLRAQWATVEDRLIAEAANLATNLEADARRFAVDVENARLRSHELRSQIEASRLSTKTLEIQIETTRKLVEQDVIDASELILLETQFASLGATIAETQTLLEEADKNLSLAELRQQAFAKNSVNSPSIEKELNLLQKQIEVQNRLMAEIDTELKILNQQNATEIKAPFDGVVSHIYMNAGEVVDVNTPLLAITETNPTEVVAFIDPYLADQIQPGMEVQVVTIGTDVKIAPSRIESVGPVVEQLPQQLWRNPTTPQWGRPFLIRVETPGLNLVVGETVGIRRL